MIRLVAEGARNGPGWNQPLEPGRDYVLGRGRTADLVAGWDHCISRRQARLRVVDATVDVERLPEASNPLCFEGRTVDRCRVDPGQVFVIGETTFHVIETAPGASTGRQPVTEVIFQKHELQRAPFVDADRRIEVLCRLPEVIWGAPDETERQVRLANLILAGVAHADAAAIVAIGPAGDVQVRHWERRHETAGGFQPSGRLVLDALATRKRTVLHVWEAAHSMPAEYTATAECDWAFCTPVGESGGDSWGLYVTGRHDRPFLPAGMDAAGQQRLRGDVKFTELIAEVIRSVERTKTLERRQSMFRQFFAPQVLEALHESGESGLLEPRLCEVTVLFCDLRGFSHTAEESADDLMGLLGRVSGALEVMTENIRAHGGVTGDFQGDAALGFWGWPLADDDAPLRACRAALGIRRAFAEASRQADHALADFQVGIGVAHGQAVAGKIGTSDQVKITVFGPVVNLASRLESMTKQLHVPIVLDESTAAAVRDRLDSRDGRLRTLARVKPFGMETSLLVNELLPPEHESPELTSELLDQYDSAVRHFIAGRWDEAHRCLHNLPDEDRAQDFLRQLITQHHRQPPTDWNGTVSLRRK